MSDEPKRLWSGFAERAALGAGEAGNVDAERDAHEEFERARQSLLQRQLRNELRARRTGLSIAEEARREKAAYERALQGQAGVDYWPDIRCKICGCVEWLDKERGRIKRYHDPVKHAVETKDEMDAPRSRQLTMSNLSGLAENIRARRSTGERDDDDE